MTNFISPNFGSTPATQTTRVNFDSVARQLVAPRNGRIEIRSLHVTAYSNTDVQILTPNPVYCPWWIARCGINMYPSFVPFGDFLPLLPTQLQSMELLACGYFELRRAPHRRIRFAPKTVVAESGSQLLVITNNVQAMVGVGGVILLDAAVAVDVLGIEQAGDNLPYILRP